MAGLGAIVRRQTCRMRRVTGSSTGTAMTPDGSDVRVLVGDLASRPDGVTIDPARRHLFYTFMGTTRTGDGDFWENEGYIERANYDGSERRVIVPLGVTIRCSDLAFRSGNTTVPA